MRAKVHKLLILMGAILGSAVMASCNSVESNIWIVERDMPQTRNLIPILNRTTLVAAGSGAAADCSISRQVQGIHIRQGPFWPNFGKKARMGMPVLVPDDFPCQEPRLLEAPEISGSGEKVFLKWSSIKLNEGEGAAVHADTWLGPPDMFHTDQGLRFGDIAVTTKYQARLEAGTSVRLICAITITNQHSQPVQALEFSFFLPRALLNNETGGEIPLLEGFTYTAAGFSDAQPLDLLICDGLARGAWGPRFTVIMQSLGPGESFDCSLTAAGKIPGSELVIVPLVSLMARLAARYWPSSQIEISPPGKTHYSDYTHFNLVVADSRLFRLAPGKCAVEPSSPLVRQYLGTGMSGNK